MAMMIEPRIRDQYVGETKIKLTAKDLNFFYGKFHALKNIQLPSGDQPP